MHRLKLPFLGLVTSLVLGFSAVSAAHAGTTVVTFDSLPTDESLVPATYDGLSFDSFFTLGTNVTYDNYALGVVTGTAIAGLNSGDNSIGFNMRVDQVGGYFNSPHKNAVILTATGYDGTTEIGSESFTLLNSGAQWLDFSGLGDLTRLVINETDGPATTNPFNCQAGSCNQFTLDNLSFTPVVSPVPEPAAWLLLSAGLLLLGVTRRARPVVASLA